MSAITATHGVPLAKPRSASRGKSKYPFASMAIDEFFFVEDRHTNQFSTYASMMGRKLGRQFRTRMVWAKRRRAEDNTLRWGVVEAGTKGAVEGVGVWRVG